MSEPRPHICLVIPVFNEEDGLAALEAALHKALDGRDFSWSALFVDDGSSDGTLAAIRKLHDADPRFGAISFSRNFGKDVAIAAGLRYARGDAVVLLDADLQHPPDVIPAFVARWREGAKVVFGQRRSREADSWARRLYSRLFHAIFRRIAQTRLPIGVVDFLLLDRKAVDSINRLGERTRFSKGLYAWIGFPSAVVPFDSADRFVGASRWSFWKLAQFALDGFVSFSSLPLKVWSYIGALISLAALVYGGYVVVYTLLFDADVPGFPSLIVSIMFFAGVQLVSLGVIGEYLARIYEEVKARPLFVVAEEIGVSGDAVPARSVRQREPAA
jgi:glycosyltransferase involved in cell wall biosynthesis